MISTSSMFPHGSAFPAGEGRPPHALPRVRAAGFFAFLAFAAMLYGSKLWVIGAYGNATPYWDQWPGEASFLYHPLVAGTFHWTRLLAPANEHHIFTARLLEVALLQLNGIWNPLLEMVVNAALHVLTLCLLIAMLARTIGRDQLPALLLFGLAFFSVPFGWENTLCGYQAEFYFVVLFSAGCLWLTATREPFSAAWWAGLACAVLAVLSFGSGLCAPAAVAVLGLLHYALGLRRSRKQLLAIAIHAGLAILGIVLTPSVSYHVGLKAASVAQFLYAWTSILAWPISFKFYWAALVNLPALVFLGVVLRRRPAASSRDWFLVALVAWAFIQDASVAYGRAAGFRPARYLDLYAVGVLANFACALRLGLDRLKRPYGWRIPAVAVWCGAILISVGVSARRDLPDDLATRRDTAFAQETNTRAYLATGDFKYLKDKPMFHLPFPDAKILVSFLTTPEIRAILPANIRADAKSGRLDKAVTCLLSSYPVFLMLGPVFVLILLMQYGLMCSIAVQDSHAVPGLTLNAMQTDPPDNMSTFAGERLKSPENRFDIDASRQESYAQRRAS